MKTQYFSPILIYGVLLTATSAEMLLSCGHTALKGHVYLVSGNQMPSPDRAPSQPKGIKTTL